MNLSAHYNQLYLASAAKIANGDYEIDKLIDAADDNRFGITLVIRPDESTKAKIQHFLDEVKVIERSHGWWLTNR